MNERIRELAIETRLLTDWPVGEVEYQKFAELIVRECIDCIRGAGLTDEVAVKNNLGFNDGLSAAVDNVQHHFGVEK
jgi:hypothetical protein